MARERRRGIVKPSGVIASASEVRTRKALSDAKRNNSWQQEAWRFYDTIGEYRYTIDWLGAMVGKTRLYAGHINEEGVVEELTDGPIFEYVEDLFGGPAAKAETMRQLGIHFSVAGEATIIGTSREVTDGEFVDSGWYVAASSEVTAFGEEPYQKYRVNGVEVPGDAHVAVRIYQPHPMRFGESNSASRAALGILAELEGLTAHTMAQINSRLSSAGVWLLSDELTLPTRQTGEDEEVAVADSTPDEVIATLMSAASAALRNPGSAEALIPIVLTAPASAIEASKYVTFWTPLDEHAKELRDESLRRLGLAMDVPPEVLTGVAETNHWAAWASDESGIKAHGEPLAARITQALTEGLLWKYARSLEGEYPDIAQNYDTFVIAADTSAMRLRPNRAKEALELYDRGELSARALIRETGFDEGDMPTEEEYRTWITRRIANGSATPEQMAVALRLLGVDMPGPEQVEVDNGREQRPAPSLREFPEQGPPDRERGLRRKERREEQRGLAASGGPSEALVIASSLAMQRVMERAGNKLKNKVGRIPGMKAVDMYQEFGDGGVSHEELLDDAWTHIERMSQRLGVNAGSLQAALAAYATELFETKEPMSEERLRAHLAGVKKG